MKFFIKPENEREYKVWDSGWRCGLFFGLGICFIALVIALQFVK